MSEPVSFEDVACEAETEKAIKVLIDGEMHWIPKSLVHDDSEVWRDGDYGTLVIPEWFAAKEGLL